MNKKIVYTLFAIFILIILLSCDLKLSNTEENKELISSQDSTEKGLYAGLSKEFCNFHDDEYVYPTIEWKTGYTIENVNVRTAPTINSEILEIYEINTEILYIDHIYEWVCVQYENKYAYIHSDFVSSTKVKENIYTDEELYMLSHLIMGEAGGESDICQLYVGSVVLNRVNHNLFPNTIKEVIFQKGQYACTWDGNYYKEPTERCVENAKKLLTHGSMLPDNVIWQSGIKQGDGIYEIVDGVYFCY